MFGAGTSQAEKAAEAATKGGLFGLKFGAKSRAKKAAKVEEARKKAAAEEVRRKKEIAAQEAALLVEQEEIEYRDGYRVNPRPAVKLTVPRKPPALSPEEKAKRDARDLEATKDILNNLPKYQGILRNVSLFSEMGNSELEVASKGGHTGERHAPLGVFARAVCGRSPSPSPTSALASAIPRACCPGMLRKGCLAVDAWWESHEGEGEERARRPRP